MGDMNELPKAFATLDWVDDLCFGGALWVCESLGDIYVPAL